MVIQQYLKLVVIQQYDAIAFVGTKTCEPIHSDKIVEFLRHMAVLKFKKSALDMAWRPSYESILAGNLHFRWVIFGFVSWWSTGVGRWPLDLPTKIHIE